MPLFALSRPPTVSLARGHDVPDAPDAARLLSDHLDAVFRYARRRLPSDDEAEDAASETFAAAFAHLPKRFTIAPRAYLLGIARRKVADALRRRSRHPEVPLDELAERVGNAPQTNIERAERAQILREFVTSLPNAQREALLLFYLDDLPLVEIAAVLRRSPAAVNSLLQRARATIFARGKSYFWNEEASDDC